MGTISGSSVPKAKSILGINVTKPAGYKTPPNPSWRKGQDQPTNDWCSMDNTVQGKSGSGPKPTAPRSS